MVQGCAQSKALSVHLLAIAVAHNQDYVNLGPRGELAGLVRTPPFAEGDRAGGAAANHSATVLYPHVLLAFTRLWLVKGWEMYR